MEAAYSLESLARTDSGIDLLFAGVRNTRYATFLKLCRRAELLMRWREAPSTARL